MEYEMSDFNGSGYDMYENDTIFEDEPQNYSIRMVSVVFYCLTCVLGVPGNALVVWIAGVKMKRTVNTTWFLNLAIADLLCCLSIPFSVADILNDNNWPYGSIMCKVLPAVIVLNMFASVFTLSFIGLDRFVQVVLPVWAQNHRNLGVAWACCGVAWGLAFFLSLPTMILREVHTDEYLNETICTFSSGNDIQDEDNFNDDSFNSQQALTVSRFILGFLIPLLAISLCYALIGRKVSSSRFRTGRAFRIMLAVVVAFFLSWLPYHVLGLLQIYSGPNVSRLTRKVDSLAISLAYVNSCMNPVLYVFMGQDFKEKVKLSLRRIFERAFSEDGTHSSLCSKGQSHATNTSEAPV